MQADYFMMNLPGFTAEASLYNKELGYGGMYRARISKALVDSKHMVTSQSKFITLARYIGDIGFPGQDVMGACAHVCATVYGHRWGSAGHNKCIADCFVSIAFPRFAS
jgi:hypothetical protein